MKKIETASNLISDIEHLKKTVYTGNGEPSLVSRIATLTTTVEYLEKALNEKMESTKCCIEEKIEHLADTIEDRDDRQSHAETRRTHVQTAIIAGVISLVIALASIAFKLF